MVVDARPDGNRAARWLVSSVVYGRAADVPATGRASLSLRLRYALVPTS